MKTRPAGVVHADTLSKLNARTHIDPLGTFYLPTNSNEVRISDGKHAFASLISIPAQALQMAAKIAATGANTPLTAIAGTYADLAAANTSVTALRANVQTHIANLEAKVDALLAALITASLMASS